MIKKIIFLSFLLFFISNCGKDSGFVYSNEQEFVEQVIKCANEYNNIMGYENSIPLPIVVGQASLESGYGTSRFAEQGNNLFGIKEFNTDKPYIVSLDNSKIKLRKYKNKCDSVKDYMHMLNTSKLYHHFRFEIITQDLSNNQDLNKLINTLKIYAEDEEYEQKLINTINYLYKKGYLNNA